MSKLTKFKVRRSQFPLDFRIDNTTRDTNIKTLTAMPGTVFEEGTEETAETYNGLQLGLVHSVTPVKSVANSIDYYTCDIEGITEFGMHNELKLQMKITTTNEYDRPKIKLAGNDYQIMRFDGVQLTQVLAGQLKTDNIYNLSFNGTLFILSSGMIAEKEVKALLDTTDFKATETIKGISQIATQPEVDAGLEDTKIVTSKKLKARLDSMLASITSTYVKLTQLATETAAGISQIATQIEVDSGTDDTKIVTSKKLLSRLSKDTWKQVFVGEYTVNGGVVCNLPPVWSEILVYYSVYAGSDWRQHQTGMLITVSERGNGINLSHYGGDGYEIRLTVNSSNQLILVDRQGDAVVRKVLYKEH